MTNFQDFIHATMTDAVKIAGGVYTDFYGQPMDYSHATARADDNFTICAGAPGLHAQLQAIIGKQS